MVLFRVFGAPTCIFLDSKTKGGTTQHFLLLPPWKLVFATFSHLREILISLKPIPGVHRGFGSSAFQVDVVIEKDRSAHSKNNMEG